MVLQMPVFLILFGAEASALQGDIAASLTEYLDGKETGNITLWRVDTAEALPAPLAGECASACHDLRWQDMQAEGYIETAFSMDIQRMIDSQIDPVGHQANCYVGVVVCGAQENTQALGELHRRLDGMLACLNRRLRSHLIWLIEDRVTHLGANYGMLSEALGSPQPALEPYQRVTVLSASQMNGGHSSATRRQRLDALVPCVLETVNAAALDGAKVQTVAYRKLNCTSAEIRRLMGQRVIDALHEWLLEPMDSNALWKLVSTDELPLADESDLEPGMMAQALVQRLMAQLPSAAELLVVKDPKHPGDPVGMVADFQQNNEDALLERFTGDAWCARWLESVEARLRRCLTLRTAMDFVGAQGLMGKRLAVMIDETAALARGHDYHYAQAAQGGWFERRRTAYAPLVAAADEYRFALGGRILSAQLKRLQKMRPQVAALCAAMLDGMEEALRPYRLPAELETLYHALAEPYDEAIDAALRSLRLTDDAFLGDAQVYYPADGAALQDLWRGIYQRVMARVTAANPIFTQGFSGAYALGKEPVELETDIRNSLSPCSWQLSGGTVAETDVAVYYAAGCICDKFPAQRLGGEALRRIPGDLVAYIRFGAAADTLADLMSFIPFRKGDGFKLNPDALRDMQATRDAPGAAAPPPEPPPIQEAGQNPWHIRLDERGSRFMLYWVWPNGDRSDADIQITHASGQRLTLTCSHDAYISSMGCAIPADKLGFGVNTITVLHERQGQTIQAMGRRVAMHYQAQPTRRRKTVLLGEERVTLCQQEVSYEIDDPLMAAGLRLTRYHSAGEILSTLPVFTLLGTGRYIARFYTAAETVGICAVAEQASMLDICGD